MVEAERKKTDGSKSQKEKLAFSAREKLPYYY
jgi:hypothetical protein